MGINIKNKKSTSVIVAIILLFSSLITVIGSRYSEANTLYVGGGAGNYTSIQEAINAASSGDTIFIYSGTYHENVFISKNIKLIGESKNDTIIAGSGNRDVIHAEGCSVEIETICIKESGESEGDAGIELKNTHNCRINNISLENNYYGIYALFSNDVTIEKSAFTDNYYGIYIYRSSNNIVSENTISLSYRDGIYMQEAEFSDITLNTLSDNIKGGIFLRSSHHNNITGNNISLSERGIYLVVSGENNVTNNVITGNDIGLENEGGLSNMIHHNNFLSNEIFNARDTSTSYYDDGNEGNYWDDYTGEDENEDGIGDTPYEVPGGFNKDHYPFANPTITDTIPPEIRDVTAYPSLQELNGFTNISCLVTDNIKVGTVLLNITSPDNTSHLYNMNPLFGSTYYFEINCTIYGEYDYFIIAYDLFNNTENSSCHQFSVSLPQKLPEITSVNAYPDPQEFPQSVNISCNTNDNVGIGTVKAIVKKDGFLIGNYTMQNVNTDENGNGLYSYDFIPPYLATYSYYVWIEDVNGNQNVSAVHTFSTKDTTPPEINNISAYPILQDVNGLVNISCEIIDNHEIELAGVNILFPNGSILNNTMDNSGKVFFLNHSFSQNGTYNYSVWAKDKSNNYNSSANYSFKITFFPVANFTFIPSNPTDLDIITCEERQDKNGLGLFWYENPTAQPDSN